VKVALPTANRYWRYAAIRREYVPAHCRVGTRLLDGPVADIYDGVVQEHECCSGVESASVVHELATLISQLHVLRVSCEEPSTEEEGVKRNGRGRTFPVSNAGRLSSLHTCKLSSVRLIDSKAQHPSNGSIG
jgi:hypothetical protein